VLSVDEAIAEILAEVEPRQPVTTSLDDALGLVLADDIVSNIDSPPFDKSQMDGFAVRAADLTTTPAALQVVETITAGQTPQVQISAGAAAQIMTGAPMPEGADAVVPIERCDFTTGDEKVIVRESVESGAYVVRQGASMARGETVLAAGTRLGPPQSGLLAELGHAQISVFPRPLVGVLATGDELVDIDQELGPGQIRNSNQSMLLAQMRRSSAAVWPLGIARDNRKHLDGKIAAGLVCDILCLSGGVSAGQLDLVPAALRDAGVRQVFHKVQMKPGKPIWFGKLDGDKAPDGRARWIFGLPGNPVSSMVCCELFVRTALRRLMGIDSAEPQSILARLEVEQASRGDRLTYFPAQVSWTADGPTVKTVDWRGSFDLRAAAKADSMIQIGPGERVYSAGEQVPVFVW
jgi:molybdopterin molybdotransferase